MYDYLTHINKDFARDDLRHATLGGVYQDCDFSLNDVTGADLCGEFNDCTFNATIRRARQTGTFIDCQEVG